MDPHIFAGPVLGPIWGLKWLPKWTQNGPTVETKFVLTIRWNSLVFTKIQCPHANYTFWVTGFLSCWILGPKMDLKHVIEIAKSWVKTWTDVWTCFSDLWSRHGSILGAILRLKKRQETPRWAQEGHQEPQSTEKQYLPKKQIKSKNHTFRVLETPKTSMRGSRRLPRDTWRASRPQKQGFQKWNWQIVFWASFGAYLGPKMNSKNDQSNDKKWPKIGTASWEQ